jgi:hypothetical protein
VGLRLLVLKRIPLTGPSDRIRRAVRIRKFLYGALYNCVFITRKTDSYKINVYKNGAALLDAFLSIFYGLARKFDVAASVAAV